MLQSLHSLQQENQRLQDQILSLTAKKERLQLLNTELAVPFPPQVHSTQGSLHASAQINFLSSTQGQIELFRPLSHPDLRTHNSLSHLLLLPALLRPPSAAPPAHTVHLWMLINRRISFDSTENGVRRRFGSFHPVIVALISLDPLSTNKSPLSKSCFLNDTSFVTSSEVRNVSSFHTFKSPSGTISKYIVGFFPLWLFSCCWAVSSVKSCSLAVLSLLQELHSGSPSRSSSSLSFQSTPPPQQSPASFGQPLLNGLSRGLSDGLGAMGQAGGSALPVMGGLMASLAGSPQLSVNGVLGGLNGVIQSPVQNAPQPTLPALRPQPPPLNPLALPQSFQLPKSASPYVSNLPLKRASVRTFTSRHRIQMFLVFNPPER